MKGRVVGIFDSGAGGMSVYREIARILPELEYIYYSDNAWCPYGEKPVQEIEWRAHEVTDFLIEKGAEIIVVACNTATSAAIKSLRRDYPQLRFIGMEPAVKLAAERTKKGVIGVLATCATLKGEKYHDNKELNAQGIRVIERVGEGFVEAVEEGRTDCPETDELIRKAISPMLEAGVDQIVLGCTHYPFLQGAISRIAGEGVTIIDPAPSVARHLVHVLEDEALIDAALAAKALARLDSPSVGADLTAVASARTSNGAATVDPSSPDPSSVGATALPVTRLYASGSTETIEKIFLSLKQS